MVHITGYSGPLREGQNMNLSCSSAISNSIDNVSWLFTPNETHDSKVVSNNEVLFKYNITLSDSGLYTCDIDTPEAHSKASIMVQVLALEEPYWHGNHEHYQSHRNKSYNPDNIQSNTEGDRLDSLLYNLLHLDPLYVALGSALAALAVTILLTIYVVRRVKRKLRKDEEIGKTDMIIFLYNSFL